MQNKKWILLCFCLILFSVLCSGCNYSDSEIKNRLIVQAIGVDALEEGVRVTLQTLNTEMTGNPNSGSNLGDVIACVTAEGSSVSNAIANIGKKVGKRPLLSQNRLIIFGKNTAKKGLYPYLDYFVRSSQNRATVSLALSETTAEELVSLKMGESILSADSLENILKGQAFQMETIDQAFFQFINELDMRYTDAYLPVVKIAPNRQGEAKFQISSVGIFSKDQLCYEIYGRDIAALALLNDAAMGGSFSFTIKPYHTQSTVHILKSITKIKTDLVQGKPTFNIEVDMTVSLQENQTEIPFMVEKQFLNAAKIACEETMDAMLYENIETILRQKKSDPFLFAHRFALAHPLYYRKHHENFLAEVIEGKYSVKTTVHIVNIGLGMENF